MVWEQLTDHLQVLYGAAAALAIVLVLTPAVGASARYLRLIERKREGHRDRPTIPRLGGLLLGAAVATTVGAIDDCRGLPWFLKLSGQVLAAAIPTGFGVWVHTF